MGLEIGTIIGGQYRVERLLGRGAMGEVYLVADHFAGEELLALKILAPHISQDSKALERFQNEARIGRKLRNKHIVTVYHIGKTEAGQVFFAMEYVDGVSLRAKLREAKGPLEFKEVLSILYHLAGALRDVHELKIVHRDLKPENIFLTKEGQVKLGDFGVAKILGDLENNQESKIPQGEMQSSPGGSQSEQLISGNANPDTYFTVATGTPEYAPLEQKLGYAIDRRVDIYSFGIIAFELATGVRPEKFERKRAAKERLGDHVIPSFHGSRIPRWFEHFVKRCCESEKDKRFDSMQEVARELFPHLDAAGVKILSVDALIDSPEASSDLSQTSEGVVGTIRRKWNQLDTNFKRFPIAIFIWLLTTYLSFPLGFPYSGQLERVVDYELLSAQFRFRGRMEPSNQVVKVAIRQKTLENLDEKISEALPRQRVTEALEVLHEYQPRAVLLDMRAIDRFSPIVDKRFAAAIKLQPTYLAKFLANRSGVEVSSLSDEMEDDRWLSSREEFIENAAGVFSGMLDRVDGNVVYHFHFTRNRGLLFPPLAEIIYGSNPPPGELPVPGDFINYYGPAGTIKTQLMDRVINRQIPNPHQVFKGKYVIIGYELELITPEKQAAQPDQFPIPFKTYLYGVEIHSTILSNLLEKDWLKRPPISEHFIFFGIVAVSISLLIISRSRRGALILSMALTSLSLLVSYIAFCHNYYLPVSGIALVCLLSCLVAGAYSIFERFGRKLFNSQ